MRTSRLRQVLTVKRDYVFEENQIYFDGTPFDGEVIYTGALDELFDCQFGRLPYRSLRFDFEHYEKESYQGHSVVNYTVSVVLQESRV